MIKHNGLNTCLSFILGNHTSMTARKKEKYKSTGIEMRGNNNTYMMSTQFGEMKREWRKIYDWAKAKWKLKLSVHGRYAGEVSVPAQVLWKTWEMELWVSSTDAGTRSGRSSSTFAEERRLQRPSGMWGRETEGENKQKRVDSAEGNSTLQPRPLSDFCPRQGPPPHPQPCGARHAPSGEAERRPKMPFRGGHFGSCQEADWPRQRSSPAPSCAIIFGKRLSLTWMSRKTSAYLRRLSMKHRNQDAEDTFFKRKP